MPVRTTPYAQFNFTVTFPGFQSDSAAPIAGFQECSNLAQEVTVTEYRNGNEPMNHVRKVNTLNKATDVTLKRGIIGSLAYFQWIAAIRNGSFSDAQFGIQDVAIALMSEDHLTTVFTWTLNRARVIKHVCGPLNAKGTDIAMEELTLAYEWLDMA
jgi:phage tail-like protein